LSLGPKFYGTVCAILGVKLSSPCNAILLPLLAVVAGVAVITQQVFNTNLHGGGPKAGAAFVLV
jgi:hypothetical protein